MKPRPHSNVCRERMYKEMKKTEEGRRWMEEPEARSNDYLEEKVRKDHEDKDEAERKESQAETDKMQRVLLGCCPVGLLLMRLPVEVEYIPEKTAG